MSRDFAFLVIQNFFIDRKQTLNLIVKLLKRLDKFSDDANLDEMTYNELVFYSQILPSYSTLLKNAGVDFEATWTPKFYYGFYGLTNGISLFPYLKRLVKALRSFLEFGSGKTPEGVFVFENLTNSGYRMAPRDKLDEKHILMMTKSIAQIHAASYALKIQNRGKFDEFVGSFKAYPFSRKEKSMADAFYEISLDRLLRHVSSTDQEPEYLAAVMKLHTKYIEWPSKLLQDFLVDDPVFNIIVHGDYNRNNVMFKYASDEGFADPVGLKIYDFQWIKYASPVLDLSFFLYMNLDPKIRATSWDKILKFYHETLIASISKLLKCEDNDKRLESLNFEAFLEHFANYAFYGCTISTWFLPVMLSDLETCKNIEIEINKDMFSQATKDVCMSAGGLEGMARVSANVKHAFDKGYLKRLIEH